MNRPGVLWHGRGDYRRLLLGLVLVEMGLLLGDDSSVGSHNGFWKFATVGQVIVVEWLFSEESAK
jgi:hypothetical protein